jgi:hypothetical protein
MIILRDVPLEKRADFLVKSVRAYPDSPAFDDAVRDYAQTSGVDIVAGLKAFHDLTRRIYADIAHVEGQDDDDKYRGLLASMEFLYAAFACGELVCERDRYSMVIDKVTLKQQYKRGGFDQRQRHLERHGLSLRYLSGPSAALCACKSVGKASHLALAYDGYPGLVPAAHYFAGRIASVPQTRLDQLNKLGIFLKGEYETAVLSQPIPRDAFDPLRKDLLDTIDAYRAEWLGLVDRFLHQCGLECWGEWACYGPVWGISFAAKGKRPLAIFTLGPDIVFIEFTLPPSAAEAIIRERKSYSEPIRKRIESFGCVKCPKKCQGSNLTKVDGVWLCTGRAEARRIYTTLSSPEDFKSIHSMLDQICDS